ncbi:MAG: ATP-dependent DNA helicase [Gammaproteobacteria bacterium]|nr:ATP-dependent DNA helicase [Gammaproteobacteria bacterium]
MARSAALLSAQGPLKDAIEGFEARLSQQELAAQVEDALTHRGVLVAESGTGTGKTFAYLVPVLLSGKKVLISTGTKHLQDQLFLRDLPALSRALGRSVEIALLKGRSNYLCLHRFALNRETEVGLEAQRAHVAVWKSITATGDISELAEVPEDSPIWPRVTSTVESCLGATCPEYEDCFVARARKRALEAHVVVVNHHLFFADLALKKDGFGQLLPGTDAVVFDEAHQLPNVASRFFGTSISSHQLLELCADIREEEFRAGSGIAGLVDQTQTLIDAVAGARIAARALDGRLAWEALDGVADFTGRLEHIRAQLGSLCEYLEVAAPASEGLTRCNARAQELLGQMYGILEGGDQSSVRWLEFTPRTFRLHTTPIDVGGLLRPYFEDRDKAWVFTSATLTVAHRFDHYRAQMGLADASEVQWGSPYDFRTQALLYLPPGLPDPRSERYGQAVYHAVFPVLEASRGRTFWLFTSHRALREAQQRLADSSFNLLVQGSAPRANLLERFRNTPRSVLLGTYSFWEGVDVRGDALSCVIIDKLPFEPPDDPVTRARLRAIEAAGGNPFTEYQLPSAVISVKQGAGRLIRDSRDRGVLVLCDPRVLSKNYGRIFLDSLPDMPRTETIEDVNEFFAQSPS